MTGSYTKKFYFPAAGFRLFQDITINLTVFGITPTGIQRYKV